MIERFVLDTSLFTNPYARKNLGRNSEEAVENFIKLMEKCKPKWELYMPPSILNELKNFSSSAHKMEFITTIKSPTTGEIFIPSTILLNFLEEIRNRLNKGLRIAEEYAKKESLKEEEIKKLREKYREHVRKGIIDSKEDLEVVLLAKELNARVVTKDEGIIKMCQMLGVSFLSPEVFLDNLLKQCGRKKED